MSDPNYLSVSLLLNFEGSDGSTTFTDSGPDALTVTPVGDVQIDTAQAPSGASSSGLFDGSGDYLTVPTNSKHALASGTKIFTIDGYIRPTAHSGIIAFAKGTSVITWATGNLEWLVYVNPSSALEFQMRNSTTTSATYSGGTISLGGVWQHFEIASDGTTVRGFLDGVQVFSESMTGLYSSVASPSLEVGRLGSAGLGFTGHMAPLRITPGVCRHTSAFTPPPAPFPDSSPVEEDALAIATPASIGITPGTGSATGQRNVTATATPASVSVTPGTGQALIKLDAVAVAVPASLSITPGTGRGVTGAALNYPTYKVVRDPYIDPIYNRGKIILSRPLSAGQRISIERKTPITQTVNFTRDDPFPAEGFEYAMDKITFIQQEIEGHACDCRPKDAEDDAEDDYYDEFPVCRPYSCSAYVDALEAAAIPLLKLYRPNLLDSFAWPFATSNNDGNLEFYNFFTATPVIQTNWGGLVRKADATEWFDADAYMDNCDGKAVHVVSIAGPSTGDSALLLSDGDGIGGDWFVSAIVAPHDGGSVMHRNIARCSNKRWSFTISGSPYFNSAAQCGMAITSPTTIAINTNDTDVETFTVDSMVDKWSIVSVEVRSTTPVVVPNGARFDLVTEVTVRARVNGESFSKTGIVKFAESVPSIENVTRVNNNLYSQTRVMYGVNNTQAISVMYLATDTISETVDLEALELGFLRSFTGYTPPDFCIFPKD